MLTAEFIKAGKAVFTVSNNKGEHYTFKVCKVKTGYLTQYFVKLRTGEDYTYMGMMKSNPSPTFIHPYAIPTKASKMKADSKPFMVFNWAICVIFNSKELPAGYAIQHEGKCGKCGRPLTNPQSIETGLGPVCSGKL